MLAQQDLIIVSCWSRYPPLNRYRRFSCKMRELVLFSGKTRIAVTKVKTWSKKYKKWIHIRFLKNSPTCAIFLRKTPNRSILSHGNDDIIFVSGIQAKTCRKMSRRIQNLRQENKRIRVPALKCHNWRSSTPCCCIIITSILPVRRYGEHAEKPALAIWPWLRKPRNSINRTSRETQRQHQRNRANAALKGVSRALRRSEKKKQQA